MSKRDYNVNGIVIPKETNPPWYMDDFYVALAFIMYFVIILGVPAICMTFGWGGSHW